MFQVIEDAFSEWPNRHPNTFEDWYPMVPGRASFKPWMMLLAADVVSGEIVGVDLPAAVELAVTETEPGVQGDRVSGARKPATLETGHVVQVPLFVNPGDRIRVDTRSGDYLTRV